MLSQALTAFGRPLTRIETPTPVPAGSEVLLRVCHAGVCHTDLHLRSGHFDLGEGKELSLGDFALPHTLGHEIEGEVIAKGEGAADVALGQRFAIYAWIGCGECRDCRAGRENLCARPRNLGCSSGCAGGYASHVLVPHPRYLIEYGTTSPALAATYMCSGLTAFSAMKQLADVADGEVLVLGCGGVGLMGLGLFRALYNKAASAADVDPGRADIARAAGAGKFYDAGTATTPKDIRTATGGGVDAVVDFVGSAASFRFASRIVRKGARIVVVGLFGGTVPLELPSLVLKPYSIVGTLVGSLPEAREMMALVRAGHVAPIPIETRPLESANAALEDLAQGKIRGRCVLVP